MVWFPEYSRLTVETDLSHVFVDYDSDYQHYFDDYASDEVRRLVLAGLGRRPALALHLQLSSVYPGSQELADVVRGRILSHWPAVVLDP